MPDANDAQTPSANDEPEVRRALRSCAATAALADGELRPIEGGLSNRAWRLDARGHSYFVRIGHPDAARFGVDRVSECHVLRAVAIAGLAPEVVACEPAFDLLVTRYVDAAPWQVPDVVCPGNLRRVADCLRRLHETPLPDAVHTVDYARQARNLESELPRGDGVAQDLRALATPAFARLQDRPASWALCHHDLHHLNVLDDGKRLWLVDWEYGGRGDALMDIAGFLAMHELGPAATAEFLAAYGRLAPADLVRLHDARWTFDYVQWLWYRLRFAGDPPERGAHAEGLAQRLLRCNNERLKQADG